MSGLGQGRGGLPNQVGVAFEGGIVTLNPQPGSWSQVQPVGQIDGLEDRPDLMVPVGAVSQDFQG